MKKNIINNILIFIVIFLILFIVTNVFKYIYVTDEIYSYGFSYNIAKGLTPYVDFNMIVGPFYNYLMTIPILIFGNKLIMYEVFNLLLFSFMFTLLYKKYGIKIWILIAAYLAGENLFMYNNFCIFTILGIILLLDSKYKYKIPIIGLLIGLIIITKHNIGGVLALIYFFTGKDKIKRTIYASIPVFIMFIILLINNNLIGYLEYCIFGMGNFLSNVLVDVVSLILFVLMVYVLVRDYLKTKKEYILYIIGSLIMIFPILDYNHIFFCLILFMYHLIRTDQLKKYISVLFISVITFTFFIRMFDGFVFGVTREYNSNFLKYKNVENVSLDEMKMIKEFYNTHEGRIFIFGDNAYQDKLYLNKTLDFYDLIHKGNLGKNEHKYIDEMNDYCKNNKCYFILLKDMYNTDRNIYSQVIVEFKDVVEEKYNYMYITNYYKVYEN